MYEFETLEYQAIENVLRDGNDVTRNDDVTTYGGIAHYGLGQWLNLCWTHYYAQTFYWHQEIETHRHYRREIFRSDQIKPKPILIEEHWQDDEHALSTLRSYVNMGRVKLQADGQVLEGMRGLQVHGGDVFPPALHAAAAAVVGIEHHPPRKKDDTL